MAWISDAIKGGNNLNFCIQASNPRFHCIANPNDETLSEAIESAFPLRTENVILRWNYISIPLSYKYDISYMVEDILRLIDFMQSSDVGKMVIHWLPDTFRCDWLVEWRDDEVQICSKWECTVGHLETLLNEKNSVSLSLSDFISEWKEVLAVLISALGRCGYNASKISGMTELIERYQKINTSGIMYKD